LEVLAYFSQAVKGILEEPPKRIFDYSHRQLMADKPLDYSYRPKYEIHD
jgi:hypothetical protein